MEDNQQPPNSALDVKLDYIQRDIGEIKRDIKEIKSDYISRREFEDVIKTVREEFAPYKKFIIAIISLFGVAIVGALLNLVIKK